MRMKSKIFTSFLLAAVLLSGCKKDDPAPDKATLSVSPQTAIAFTAAATETFTVKVVTNQPAWKAESSQSWCKVAAGEGQFTVSADPNTSETAPTPAVITVTAGSEKATIDVTQAAAGKEQYPDTEAKLKQAIAKVWTFAESSNYVSLEFTTDGLYTFLSKTPFTRAAENNIYLLSGAYSVAADLHELTLSDFGKITISDVGNGKASMTIAPTGGTPSAAELDEQRFVTPPASADKKIKRVESVDPTEGNGAIEYSYDANRRMSKIKVTQGGLALEIPINYEDGKVWYQFEGGEALGEPGVFKVTYTLNAAGLARSSVIQHKGVVLYKIYYTYNNQRQLVSYRMTDNAGKLDGFCNATWVNGDVVSTYSESAHTCDGGYDEYDGHKYYHHDHNGDGIFNQEDIITRETDHSTYSYSARENKGGYMYPIVTPDIFGSSDVFDQLGQWIGVLGVSCKHLMSEHADADGALTYQFDAEGYPTRIDVSFPEDPSDNWYILQTYE